MGRKGVDFQTALREIGAMAGIVESNKPSDMLRFKYTDEAGNLLYIKERTVSGRNVRSKDFAFKHLEGCKWVEGRGYGRTLYRLPELVNPAIPL
ncbi:MAG: hypothetical protein FJ266_16880 [Planctomycetes bacterium]|nr:hypothetical protein [Planctomycetota bacterium]